MLNIYSLRLELSVYCERDYYGSDCRKFCSPGSNDHYSCSASGDKLCHSGWTGSTCDTRINYCLNVVCKNGGNCQRLSNGFMCSCPRGYEGPLCEDDVNECESNVCKNGAVCTNLNGSFACACLPFWEGITCEKNINECLSSPCNNGGICLDKVKGYVCECAEGWLGETCAIDRDECETSSVCSNGATCLNTPGSYKCLCAEGWRGQVCEQDIDECGMINFCHNGGACVNTRGSFMCRCPPTWTGRRCETDVDECVTLPELCGRNGSCLNLPGDFRCQCDPGLTGFMCDEDVDECSLSKDLCAYVGNFPPFTPNVTFSIERANMPTLSINITETKNKTEDSLFINGSSSDLPTSPPWPDAPVSHILCVNTQPGYRCICQVFWRGAKCDQTLTECILGPDHAQGVSKAPNKDRCPEFFLPLLHTHPFPLNTHLSFAPEMTVPFYLVGQPSLQTQSYVNSNLSRLLRESRLFEGKELNLTSTFTHGITPSGKKITKVHPVVSVGGEILTDSELTYVLRTLSPKVTDLINWTLYTGYVLSNHGKIFHMWYLVPIIAGLLLLLVSVAGAVLCLR
ncbi:neurogenic locus notch-like protein 1 [Plakobranchus ocellatus]|uniref:Delta-like protein n=1 Tax=Plakobranchus ocellatus TaxID=259542 RepID=A0AAV3ZGM7_9GAST|nr:neurogenic locus notch-like protein 1 [Plakobranchus ocellatus]